MNSNKSFYFVRHGETDLNAGYILHDETDVSLNENGRRQAHLIRPIIEKLPIQTVCISPLKRAQETAEIITHSLNCSFTIIEELRECSGEIWSKMTNLEFCDLVQSFMQKVIVGINRALSFPDPVLIVAHGGVHWAMCHQLDIKEHEKKIDHCIPIHFRYEEAWKALSL